MPLQPHDDELDELVFAYLEQVEEGIPPDEAAERIEAGHPERVEAFRSSIDALRAAGLLELPATDQGDFPDEIGGYSLLRRLGAGGMGVVFLAEAPTGERVALKLIRPEQLYFDRSRKRFSRELESASRLDHPGIAPIVDSGEEHGIPFLAQGWVPGVALDTLLDKLRKHPPEKLSGELLAEILQDNLPSEADAGPCTGPIFKGAWERAILRIVSQVADALEHAHQRGVLHRDIKPSNVMLTAAGRAVLIDFGVARVSDATRLTVTGAQPGSLLYMSPEQLDGSTDELDQRSDVYALGVTLYELLTLKQPYKSHSAERVRHLIHEAHPEAPRRLNATLSPQAEVVCMMAMDPSPARRYPSAGDFRDDMERLIGGGRIIARPPSAMLRSIRWARRKPMQAAVASLLMLAPLSWALFSQWAMTKVEAAYHEEQLAHASADRHFTITLEAIRSLLADMAEGPLSQTPQMQRMRLEAIDRALVLLKGLEVERPDDLRLRSNHAHVLRLRGDALGDTEQLEEAIAAYKEEVAIFKELRVMEGISAEAAIAFKREMSLGVERSAALTCLGANSMEELEPYVEALSLMREVAAEAPEENLAGPQLVVSLGTYAYLLFNAGLVDDSLMIAEEGVELAEQELELRPGHAKSFQNLARLRFYRLNALLALNLKEESHLELAEIVELSRQALNLDPNDRRIRENLGDQSGRLAEALSVRGEHEKAVLASEPAVELARLLARDYPAVERYGITLMEALMNHGLILSRAGRQAEAGELLLDQAQVAEENCRNHPENARMTERAAVSLFNLALNRGLGEGKWAETRTILQRAERFLRDAVRLSPNKPTLAALRGLMDYSSALALIRLKRPDEARAALDHFEEQMPEELDPLVQGADLWSEWAVYLEQVDPPDMDEISAAREHALDLLEQAIDAGLSNANTILESDAMKQALGESPRWLDILAQLRGTTKK
ncbi:MAG: serine/threonine protein kinase [Planctomycetota bacterium]|jgi:serine/threonine protein kinase